ncbi:MAG: hypothetical protein ACYC6O_06140 [Thermoleophilia bacterium]
MGITTSGFSKLADYWVAKTDRCITEEEEREVKESVCGFFKVLNEWDIQECKKAEESIFETGEAVSDIRAGGDNGSGCSIINFPTSASFAMVTSGAA